MDLSGFSGSKRIYTALLALIVLIPTNFAFPPARAAMPPHVAVLDRQAVHGIRADLTIPALVVHLNADGSLIVSQRDRDAGAVITLPSVQALPAEIEALVPDARQRKKLAVAADPSIPFVKLTDLMRTAKETGFSAVSILEPEAEHDRGASDLVVRLVGGKPPDLNDKSLANALFVSLGDDGDVILSLGLGESAQGTVAHLANAPDAAAGLVPKGQRKKLYIRADFKVPVGEALGLLHKLRAIGFSDVMIIAEETETD